jgi:hypothetical protein
MTFQNYFHQVAKKTVRPHSCVVSRALCVHLTGVQISVMIFLKLSKFNNLKNLVIPANSNKFYQRDCSFKSNEKSHFNRYRQVASVEFRVMI